MNFDEIKTAISEGKTVHWMNPNYTVFVGCFGSLYLRCADGQNVTLTLTVGNKFVLDQAACYIA